jgi:hypothetical protein
MIVNNNKNEQNIKSLTYPCFFDSSCLPQNTLNFKKKSATKKSSEIKMMAKRVVFSEKPEIISKWD